MILKEILAKVVREMERGKFDPIMEDDLLAMVYHQMIISCDSKISGNIFVKARILQEIHGLNHKCKYDLVIGKREEKKIDKYLKVYVIPDVIIELKIFPRGLQFPQSSGHFEEMVLI